MDRDLLDIDNLEVTFATDAGDVEAVRGVSLRVAAGKTLAVVGESGSGKTVTARSIMRLLPDTALASGAIYVGGGEVLSMPARALRSLRGRDAAMVFQEPSTALNPVYTVGWQIAEGLRAHDSSLGKKAAKEKAVEALRSVGIPEPETRVNYYPHQFSGGQKQRVVIAMALALDAKLIIADEPTTALDVTVQAEILELLRRVRDDFGAAIVLITHNMGVVADLADDVAVMFRGEVVETADAATLFSRPAHEYTKSLLAAVPHLGRNSASRHLVRDAESGAAPGPTGDPLVEASGLVIEYPGGLGQKPFTAVEGVSFRLHPGEVFGLVGESGSGKTTIGRAIAGLTRATGGSLRVLGQEMMGFKERDFRPLRKRIGFVFQDPAASFNPHLTIGECIVEPLAVHRTDLGARELRARAAEMLESVQLPGAYAGRYPHELSGGQRQRASLARALSLEPELLIADEPTSALDVSVQAKVLELFKELQERFGFASVFISHDLAVVDMLSHRIGVLYRGRLLEQGIGYEVLTRPQNDYTKRLIASLPVPDPAEQATRREALRALGAS